jgi:hypothetical protein
MGKHLQRGRAWSAVALAAILCVACGGEDEDPNAPPPLETALGRTDTSAPTLTITGPTSFSTFSTLSSKVTLLQGVAQDNQKIARVTWVGRVGNGVADLVSAGASANWSAANVPLLDGDNSITVRAYDAENNRATRKLLVVYRANPETKTGPEGTWSTVADEWQAFAVDGTQQVRYGNGTSWVTRSVTGVGECTSSAFGGDPAPGIVKACAVLTSASAPAPAPAPSPSEGTWSKVADEWQAFVVDGTKQVRYGVGSSWITRSITGAGTCTNTAFGADPAPGIVKSCEVLTSAGAPSASPSPSPSPSPAPAPTPSPSPSPAPAPTPAPSPAPGPAPAPTSGGNASVDPSVVDPSLDAARTPLPAAPIPPGPVVLAPGEMRWSDPATWGGALPGNGAEVVVPAGKTLVLDTNTASLGALRIEGTLRLAPMDIELTAKSIRVSGALEAGAPTEPYVHRATITLTGAPAASNDGVSRGIVVQGGRLALYGAVPQPVWTRLNDHAAAGARSLTLASTVNWRAGDTLAVAPSDWYGVDPTERVTLGSVSSKTLALSTALAKPRWGKLQYLTASGMSLAQDASYTPPVAPAPTILDERAPVANLSRNIVIQGADDAYWANNGFGVHVMIMNLASKVVVDGVEIRRAGQSGALGRYPFHWHQLSYDASGQMIGDATGHVIRNSSIWNSSQRCIVIHATNGVQVLNNVCHDIKGHAIFLEDAVERRNVFDGNIALKMREPNAAQRLLIHESPSSQGGPSGFWLTNPDNIVRNNLGADALGNGFWMAFPRKPLGPSANVAMLPDRLPFGTFEHNVAHSNNAPGVLLNWAPVDDAGNVSPNQYMPTFDASETDYSDLIPVPLRRITSYKNMNGYGNNISLPDYREWTVADNVGIGVTGKVHIGTMQRSLLVGQSLNSATPYPQVWPYEKQSALATYHSTLSMTDNTIVNFPFYDNEISGAWKTFDYYTAPVDKGTIRNGNNRLIASNAGFRVLPPHMDGKPLENRHWTLSGALWDPHGYWGPKNNYHVYDVPFLTTGANCVWAAPAGKNGKSCDGEYFGINNFQASFDMSRFEFKAPLEAVRQDANGNEIGRWFVPDGVTSTMLGHMRHFAARPGGRYVVRFPDRPLPTWLAFNVDNGYRPGDTLLMALSFDGRVNAAGYTVAGQQNNREAPYDPNFVRYFQPVASLAEVSAGSGDRMWQDRANNLVWIKYVGGMGHPQEKNLVVNSDDWLYRASSIVLYSR